MACRCISQRGAKIILCIVLPILVISIVFLVLFPTIYNEVLRKELTLNKGTILTSIWEDLPLPIHEKLYFFNITNKEAFLNGSEPLNVTEVGPYTYNSKWVKNDPVWNSNGTVSYREIRTYHFVPDKSNGTEDDFIYTLNGPMIIASNIAKDFDIKLRALFSLLLGIEGEHLVIKRSIRELVYEGYADIIIKFAPIVKPDIPYKNGIFSWLYGKNATDDGLYTVFTGSDDAQKTDIMNNWNGEENLSFWKGDTCNMLNGTNIEIGPPLDGDVESYTFFQSIFCRSITFDYTEDKTHFDILTKRFRPTTSVFANSTENPDNYCFEVEKERPSGVLDISPCQFGAPVFISFPHFYTADPSFLEPVNGLNPNHEDHGSHIDVEVITGASVDISVKFQVNVELNKIEGIFQTYNATKGILPILWADINFEIDEDYANFIKGKLRNPKIIAYSVFGSLVGICLILAIFAFVVLCLSESDVEDDDPLIDAINKECKKHENFKTDCKECSKSACKSSVVPSEDETQEYPSRVSDF